MLLAREFVSYLSRQIVRKLTPQVLETPNPQAVAEIVDHIVTELAVIDITSNGLLLRELAPDATLDQVQSLTEPKLLLPPGGPKPMPV